MKKLIVLIAAMAMLIGSIGCSGSGLSSHFKKCQGGCQAPPVNPSYGYPAGDCATGNCGGQYGGGQIINSGQTSYYMDGQSDPYMNGSNLNGASINPPVFDNYSGPSYGSTIVPPANSGTLPTPSIGN